MQPALGERALAGALDSMISRGPFQPLLFCDLVPYVSWDFLFLFVAIFFSISEPIQILVAHSFSADRDMSLTVYLLHPRNVFGKEFVLSLRFGNSQSEMYPKPVTNLLGSLCASLTYYARNPTDDWH